MKAYFSKAAASVERLFTRRHAERRIEELSKEMMSYFKPLGEGVDGETVMPAEGTAGRRSEIGESVNAYLKVLKDLG